MVSRTRTLLGAGLIGTLLVALIATTFLAAQPGRTSPSAVNTSDGDAVQLSTVLREKDFGAWRYVVGRSEKGLGAMIFLREYSAEGLHAFAEANRSLAEQLAATNETVPVEITFKAPVPLDQFRVWAKSKSILVEEAQLRQKAPYDTRGTLVVPGTKDDPLPEASVRKYTFGPISGVFYVRTTIPSQQLREFVTDPLIFLVDVSPIYVRKDLAEVGMAGAETARVMHYHGIFWEMENVGVAPSPTPYPAPVGTTEPTVSP